MTWNLNRSPMLSEGLKFLCASDMDPIVDQRESHFETLTLMNHLILHRAREEY